MSRAFADTAYFIAHISRSDQYHRKALELSDRLNGHVVTSDWVLLELADGFADTRYRSYVRPLITRLRNSSISEVVPISSALLDEAIDLYHRYQDKDWTLTDCTSFLIMRERGISEALTADHHFEQAGFIALLK
jgi:predicted nucleic acid-binding protein